MNKYVFLILAGFIIKVIETWYFGWNMEPQSVGEAFWDMTTTVMIVWGLAGDILKNVTWQKSTHITVAKEDLSDTIKSI